MVRILDLTEDEYYVPSSGLIMHILRWVVIALEERFGKIQWSLDMADTVSATIASRYAVSFVNPIYHYCHVVMHFVSIHLFVFYPLVCCL